MIELAENRYGKSRVRLMKVTRHAHDHDLREWTVQVLLKGDFETAHLDGDNSKILPTDTMKNTVYSLARTSKATAMEDYAKELVDFLLGRNPQVSSASVRIESTMWKRLTVDGEPHPSAFMRGSGELQTTSVERAQGGNFHILSGLDNLVLLKTANSGFEGYIKDSLTTLSETKDRLFGTAVTAEWHYTSPDLDFDAVRTNLREAMLRTFANHNSKSVQQTLYAMAESALEAVPAINEIEITMPNKHCLLVDLSRFNQDNPNEIFVPTDEPHGYIEARVRRKS
ncbi:factor-independent urate hydroxylase [Tunturiibacter gelidoferens]|uniref:Urate oxidase n=1 Tax=Tunturiibacter gelidiferens TaxID=3069689 RepID=A0ACC5P4B3_9BACT|nr:urate oxidase [Edaphobacter lichenicola]MBB5341687.1 urate oxidase [Edaphobacter lichenicola]